VFDYFPRGYLKSKVYVTKPSDIDELKYAIKGETAATPDKYIGQCCLMCDMFPIISHHQSVVNNASENPYVGLQHIHLIQTSELSVLQF
jgi:hypothetical protein